MRIMSRFPALLAATVGTGLVVGLAGPSALAGPGTTPAGHWRIVLAGPDVGSWTIANARASLWTFGTESVGKPARIFADARHWNGRRWSRPVRVSSVENSRVVCAGASSAANVWAFVEGGGGTGFPPTPPTYAAAVKLTHGRWVTEHFLADQLGTLITGCNVLSPTDIWVFGGTIAGLGQGLGTWHLTRSGWRLLSTGRMVIVGASVVSATDIWAAAADPKTAHPILARWNGKTWTQDHSIDKALPKPTQRLLVGLGSINAVSANDVWIQATTSFQGENQSTVVVHWDGKAWHRVRLGFFGYYLPSAIADGHGGWWAVPYITNRPFRYLLHGAHGHWTKVRLPGKVLVDAFSLDMSGIPHSGILIAHGNVFGASGRVTPVLLATGPLPR